MFLPYSKILLTFHKGKTDLGGGCQDNVDTYPPYLKILIIFIKRLDCT